MSARNFKFAKDCLYGELTKFNEAWELSGTDIHCRDCAAYQSVIFAAQPFPHAYPACSNARDFARHPWEELQAALQALPDLLKNAPK